MQTQAINDTYEDKIIDRNIFRGAKRFLRGDPSDCFTITVPIHDGDHWFSAKIIFIMKRIEIFDTLTNPSARQRRQTMVQKAVRYVT